MDIEPFRPIRLGNNLFAVYVLDPDATEFQYPYCKFCINSNSALRTNQMIQSQRLVHNNLRHNIILVELKDGDKIHFVYNIGAGPIHFWGVYHNQLFWTLSKEHYKEMDKYQMLCSIERQVLCLRCFSKDIEIGELPYKCRECNYVWG